MTAMSEEFPVIRAAAVQAASVFLDSQATVEKACQLIADCGRRGADLAVFPENFIPGHPLWLHFWGGNDPRSVDAYERLFHNALTIPGPEVDRLCRAAREANVNVVMGLTERRPGMTGTLYNTQLYITRSGEIRGKHQKLVPTHREKIVHAPGGGDTLDTFLLDSTRVGGLICGENSNPLAVYALQALGEQVHASSWPPFFGSDRRTSDGLRIGFRPNHDVVELVSRGLAYSGHVYVVNAVGMVDDRLIQMLEDTLPDPNEIRRVAGGSSIVDPRGRVIAGPLPLGEEDILTADLDLARPIRAKLSHDFTGHYQRFDVFELHLRRRPLRPLVLDEEPPADPPLPPRPPHGGAES